jgi:membrane protein
LASATDAPAWLIGVTRWPLLWAVVALLLAFVYRFGPSREHAKWRWITWGSAGASLAWLVASSARRR